MNNYNKNSNGNSIEISIHKYTDDYSIQEDFEILKYNDNQDSTSILIYSCAGLDLNKDNLLNRVVITAIKKQLKEYLGDIYDLKKAELIEEAKNEIGLLAFITGNADIDYRWDNIEILSSTGYYQGDYALIIIDTKEYKITKGFIEQIDHLLWDTPVSGFITINNNEISINEFITDPYADDEQIKTEALDYIKKQYPDAYDEFKAMIEMYDINYK